MQTGEKTAFFRELLSITKNVYLWHYTYDMLPISSNCPMQNIFVNIFALNQCGIQVLAHFDAQASPCGPAAQTGRAPTGPSTL